MADYPAPPWHTHGRAYLRPLVVNSEQVRVPAPLEVVSRFGRTSALLAYIVYESPSPLLYRELLYMPCLVRVRADDGREAMGFYVEKMYVDLEGSLRAGRELWGLPKQLASFDERDGRVRVETEDGARFDLGLPRAGFGLPARSRTTTLQVRGNGVIRFVGDTTRARTTPSGLLVHSSSGTARWSGFADARALPGVSLLPFATTMRPPVVVRRDDGR